MSENPNPTPGQNVTAISFSEEALYLPKGKQIHHLDVVITFSFSMLYTEGKGSG